MASVAEGNVFSSNKDRQGLDPDSETQSSQAPSSSSSDEERSESVLSGSTEESVYACCFVDKDEFIVCGGGGAARTGVKNAVTLYRVNSLKEIFQIDEYTLEPDEDAPMSLAYNPTHQEVVCGANTSKMKMKIKENENCRVLKVTDKLTHHRAAKVFPASNEEDYIRVAAFSSSHNLLALASTNEQLQILEYPQMTPFHDSLPSQSGDLYDVSFGPDILLTAGTTGLAVYSMTPKSKKSPVKFKSLVKRPTLPGALEDDSVSYRASRFSEYHPGILFAVINATTKRKSRVNVERRTYIVKYDINTWKATKIKRLPEKGSITCFDISSDGRFLAFGNSSSAIGILDAESLAPIITILRAHDLPPTTLRFNSDSTMLLSGSADNTVRLIAVPPTGAGPAWITIILIFLTLLVLGVGIGLQAYKS